MTEKRYGKKVDDVDDTIINITEDGNDFAWFLSDDYTDEQVDKVVQRLNKLTVENEQLKQYNQQITKVLEDGGVILTKNQLNSLIKMKNDDSVEVRYLKTANAKLKDEIRALREYIQKRS